MAKGPSQQGPTNTQGPPAAIPDPDNRSRRAPGSSGLAGLWPVAGLFSFRVLLVRNLRHIQSFLINIGPDTLAVALPIEMFIQLYRYSYTVILVVPASACWPFSSTPTAFLYIDSVSFVSRE